MVTVRRDGTKMPLLECLVPLVERGLGPVWHRRLGIHALLERAALLILPCRPLRQPAGR